MSNIIEKIKMFNSIIKNKEIDKISLYNRLNNLYVINLFDILDYILKNPGDFFVVKENNDFYLLKDNKDKIFLEDISKTFDLFLNSFNYSPVDKIKEINNIIRNKSISLKYFKLLQQDLNNNVKNGVVYVEGTNELLVKYFRNKDQFDIVLKKDNELTESLKNIDSKNYYYLINYCVQYSFFNKQYINVSYNKQEFEIKLSSKDDSADFLFMNLNERIEKDWIEFESNINKKEKDFHQYVKNCIQALKTLDKKSFPKDKDFENNLYLFLVEVENEKIRKDIIFNQEVTVKNKRM